MRCQNAWENSFMCEAHAAWYWTSQQEQFIDRSILSHHTEQGTKQLSTLKTNWLFVSACHTGMLADNRTPVGSANAIYGIFYK